MPCIAILICTSLFWSAPYRMRKTAIDISWKHFIPDSPPAHSSLDPLKNPLLLEKVLSSLCYRLVQWGDRRFWPNVWSCHVQDHLVFQWDEIMWLLKISLYQVWRDPHNISCMQSLVIWYSKNKHPRKYQLAPSPLLWWCKTKFIRFITLEVLFQRVSHSICSQVFRNHTHTEWIISISTLGHMKNHENKQLAWFFFWCWTS